MGILILTILRIIIGNQEIYKKCNELKLLFNSTIVVKIMVKENIIKNILLIIFRVSSDAGLLWFPEHKKNFSLTLIYLASLLKNVNFINY